MRRKVEGVSVCRVCVCVAVCVDGQNNAPLEEDPLRLDALPHRRQLLQPLDQPVQGSQGDPGPETLGHAVAQQHHLGVLGCNIVSRQVKPM